MVCIFSLGETIVMMTKETVVMLAQYSGWVSQMFFEHGTNPPEADLSVFLCESLPYTSFAEAICPCI